MNRIKTRIMLICLSLVLLTVIAVQISNWWFIRDYHQQQLQNQVDTAGHFLQQYMQSRETYLFQTAEVITKDFGFRQAIASQNIPTINSMLLNHSQRMQADLMMITDWQGKLIASTLQSGQFESLDYQNWVSGSLPFGEARFLSLGDKLFRCFALPIKAPRGFTHAIIGYQITPELLTELEIKTGLALHFVVAKAGNEQLFSSSIREWQLLQKNKILNADGSFTLMDDISRLEVLPFKGIDEETQISLYLQANISNFEAALRQLHYRSLLMAFIILVVGVWLSSLLTKRLADPLSALYKDLIYRANHDQLTGVFNRHASLARIREELNRVSRIDNVYCIALCDIDNFKIINDTFGHSVGDAVLCKFTARLEHAIRDYDILGRYGGEEFIIAIEILPDEAKHTFERLRQIIAVTPIASDENLINVTMSCGVCIIGPDDKQPSLDKILETADSALHSAKMSGRNQVIFTRVPEALANAVSSK